MDWSADCQTFSRSPGEPRDLFAPILREAIQQHGRERMVVSVDDPRVWPTGQHVPGAQWQRDPLGPAGHTNRRRGLRFLPAAAAPARPGRDRLPPKQKRTAAIPRPACLPTTDLTTPAAILIQDYFDRWGSEVNHRDEQPSWTWATRRCGTQRRCAKGRP